jgi:murein DD-endopeptidase MepM/ murein hydrolase activator NlpD
MNKDKAPSKYVTLLVMFDASSDPKSFRMKLSRLRLLVGLAVLLAVVLVGSLIYYYFNAYKIFYYDELRDHYDQLVADNKRIQLIEREYRKIRQENEKIRLVLGMVGDSVTNHTESGEAAEGMTFWAAPQEYASAKDPGGLEESGRALVQDYLLFSRVVPSQMPVNSRFVGRGFSLATDAHSVYHPGIDIVGEEGTPVMAASDGWVVLADWLTDYGHTIVLYHGYGFFTVYKHLQYPLCREHSFVKGGQIIGTLGKTGLLATGAHLHFEVWKNGIPQDPVEYIYPLQQALSVVRGDSVAHK